MSHFRTNAGEIRPLSGVDCLFQFTCVYCLLVILKGWQLQPRDLRGLTVSMGDSR